MKFFGRKSRDLELQDNASSQARPLLASFAVDNTQRNRHRRKIVGAILLSLLALGIFAGIIIGVILKWQLNSRSDYQYPKENHIGAKGAVATEHPRCSEVGLNILKSGGNAIDAAIAAALCIGTINSFSSGIGGGGFMMIRLNNSQSTFIDFRETAPALSNHTMYQGRPEASEVGGLAVAVPGELRGFEMAHQKYGRLSWSSLVAPSTQIARDGFVVSQLLERRLKEDEQYIMADAGLREVFTRNGNLLKEGHQVQRIKFADTLQKIADNGVDAFYNGDIAQQLVSFIQENGGIISLEDLENYQAEEKPPMEGWYHGKRIVTSPLPTSGPILLEILNILEGYEMEGSSYYPSALRVHRIIEAMKFGYAARTELGDEKYLPSNFSARVQEIVSKSYASKVRANITDDKTHDWQYYNPQFDSVESPGTTHISVVDNESGTAVSMTSTINLSFGSKLMCPQTGIILNNEMDDFSLPNKTNAFGLRPSKNNFIHPGKRPLSSSVPTFVEQNGNLTMVVGASGGSKIITATLQTILNLLNGYSTAQYAIDAPRYHHQLLPNHLQVESTFYYGGVLNSLRYKNHTIVQMKQGYGLGDVQCVQRNVKTGWLDAGSDKRKGGKALAY
ncbi:hypothetical protein MP228_007596 [Amoeboaphelidium protococcarum]|nr:hypothetical protein MP228_007596 [Amoeboaphelidium protococcarum]